MLWLFGLGVLEGDTRFHLPRGQGEGAISLLVLSNCGCCLQPGPWLLLGGPGGECGWVRAPARPCPYGTTKPRSVREPRLLRLANENRHEG